MTPPTDDPPDDDGKGDKPGFDEVWGELLRSDEEEPTPASVDDQADTVVKPSEGTKAWTDDVRGERLREAGPKQEDAEMERVMTEAAQAAKDRPEEEPVPSASSPAMPIESGTFSVVPRSPSREMRLLMDEPKQEAGAKPEPDPGPDPGPDPKPDPKPRPDEDSDGFRIKPEPTSAGVAESRGEGRGMLWIIGLAAVALIGYFVLTGESEDPTGSLPKPEPIVGEQAQPEQAPPAKPTKQPLVKADGPTPIEQPPVEPSEETQEEPPPEKPPRSGDVREPPPGTPDEIADVFRKLPVSPADKPPVGGIGASGIHVDHVSVGNAYEGSKCKGGGGEFSIARGDRVSVCVRVVHKREKEDVIVLWQRDGGTVRRGKMVIKPIHAYRTRAYLALRSEYAGKWNVRIMSQDGVELAASSFTVVQ